MGLSKFNFLTHFITFQSGTVITNDSTSIALLVLYISLRMVLIAAEYFLVTGTVIWSVHQMLQCDFLGHWFLLVFNTGNNFYCFWQREGCYKWMICAKGSELNQKVLIIEASAGDELETQQRQFWCLPCRITKGRQRQTDSALRFLCGCGCVCLCDFFLFVIMWPQQEEGN